jgi:hypothetical protein
MRSFLAKNLQRHYINCKKKDAILFEKELQNQIQKNKKQQEQHEIQLQKQQEQHEIQLQKQQERHEKQIEEQQEQYEKQLEEQQKQHEKEILIQKEQIEKLELQNREYHNQLFEIAKQPKQQQITNHNNNSQTTNNRILHITNHLIPIQTDEEIRKMIDNQYTRDIFLGGSESLKDMTVSILKDQETGKYRTVCSDTSRSVFYYLDNENKLVKDIGMKNIHKKIQKPLFAATSLHYREIDQEGSIDDDKLCEIFSDNINFIDHELPNQLKPELQLPINTQD